LRLGLALTPCALLALSSCSPKHTRPAKPKTETRAPSTLGASADPPIASTRAAASAAHCDAAPLSTLSEAAVRAVVDTWRLAQKRRDLASYSGLYAEHFTGLLADGATFARLDRQAWLKAHEATLTFDSVLAKATVLVAIGAGGARVTFDNGAALGARLPELFVVPTTIGPRIVWEAQARSVVGELGVGAGPWLADEHFATLSGAPDAAWAEGPPSYAGENTALRSVSGARLPKALRAWLGRPVRVLGASGTVCETRLQRFALRARITPDLRTAERWDGCAADTPQTPDAIAQDIWRLATADGRSLVAEFSVPCKGAVLATDPGLPAPAIAAPEPAPAELGAAALEAFRKLPSYAQIEARFKLENPSAEGAWEDLQGRRSVWSLKLGERAPLLFVSVEAGSGCASFSASLSALWEVLDGASPRLSLLTVPTAQDDRRLTPAAVVDLDGRRATLLLGPDGLFSARSLLRETGRGYEQTLLSSVPFFAGPC
jgi:hypothetical protein